MESTMERRLQISHVRVEELLLFDESPVRVSSPFKGNSQAAMMTNAECSRLVARRCQMGYRLRYPINRISGEHLFHLLCFSHSRSRWTCFAVGVLGQYHLAGRWSVSAVSPADHRILIWGWQYPSPLEICATTYSGFHHLGCHGLGPAIDCKRFRTHARQPKRTLPAHTGEMGVRCSGYIADQQDAFVDC
jgi:hypothetical protein